MHEDIDEIAILDSISWSQSSLIPCQNPFEKVGRNGVSLEEIDGDFPNT